ncbi:NUDIX domain-containing protein [Oceanispirochaeta sp.]|jgi:8-oxo-dGTP pyrophosphatase MutT (NUDIX family)|uniref:NUDIX hydrolase n=1 Tax=Oceanispirochaeta sp. TaxID=2035350 RepID=UPI00262D7BC4|nr:NUDIX domain-containing protein [Oceanispirochaeta sp.]MDA3957649.1 NUDIX domain-containing protein [Oceanispirochaeta sp.]
MGHFPVKLTMALLNYEVNPFGGAVLDENSLPAHKSDFQKALSDTLTDLRSQNLQLVWLFLPLGKSGFVETAVALGFTYHHADKNGLQLTLQLIPGAFIPGYATHYLGAGGVLIDEENRILVIQEKYHTKRHYKLPGGALDPGEHIADAVVREVLEETGIRSEFISLNCFRHFHGYRYGLSDIYFVCRLKPLSTEITIDTSEISEALWMPLEEYLNHPDTHPFNRKIVSTTVNTVGLAINQIEDYGTAESHEMFFAPGD